VQRFRYGQLPVVAGRLAVAQLQTLKVHFLPAGQAHVSATGPPGAAAERDGRHDTRLRVIGFLDGGQRAVRPDVGERAAGARPVAVPVPVGAVRLEVRQGAVGGVQARLAAVHG